MNAAEWAALSGEDRLSAAEWLRVELVEWLRATPEVKPDHIASLDWQILVDAYIRVDPFVAQAGLPLEVFRHRALGAPNIELPITNAEGARFLWNTARLRPTPTEYFGSIEAAAVCGALNVLACAAVARCGVASTGVVTAALWLTRALCLAAIHAWPASRLGLSSEEQRREARRYRSTTAYAEWYSTMRQSARFVAAQNAIIRAEDDRAAGLVGERSEFAPSRDVPGLHAEHRPAAASRVPLAKPRAVSHIDEVGDDCFFGVIRR